ncbi:MAG: hypothetical protein IJ242_01380 [Clostridia bacterium]|nr:hypothetical protein [Clostridia bacterium]
MSQPYRPTYKMIFAAMDGSEIHVGNFERLDEASAYARTYEYPQDGTIRLYKYCKTEDTYKVYEKWTY